MTSEGLLQKLQSDMPDLRGKLTADRSLADITWFRVGGPAEVLFTPADEADLSYFLKQNDSRVPVTVIGLGSNLLVRDGGVPGVVIRLGRAFGQIQVEDDHQIRVGAVVPDVKVARTAGEAGIAGLSFYRGIPGSVGGALRMNAGAHGSETKDVLVAARAVAPDGTIHVLSLDDMKFTYRHCGIPDDWIFTEALFQGTPGTPEDIAIAMQDVAKYREQNQPIKERTGGSTFKNPDGHSAWKLVDAAGMRGYRVGGARVSDMHCNFLINDQGASGEDLERLGETVRARVKATSDITLHWEIKRIGIPLEGHRTGEALAGDGVSSAASAAEQQRIILRSHTMSDKLPPAPTKTVDHVAVLMGGWSSERPISLKSGTAVADALEGQGYRVSRVDVDRDVAATLAELKPDVCFNALHGPIGEDGAIQGLLECLGCAYTHSGVTASALAMHKTHAKTVMQATGGVPVADAVEVTRQAAAAAHVMPAPYVVKPISDGSSFGVVIVTNDKTPPPVEIATAGAADELVMVERYIPGRELTCAVIGDFVTDVIEICPAEAHGFYDFDAKYAPGGSKHVLPAQLLPEIYQMVRKYTLAAHRALGCRGVSRADFRFDETVPAHGGLICLEVNTQPGMTETSLVPELAAYAGWSFADLVRWIVEDARCDRSKDMAT